MTKLKIAYSTRIVSSMEKSVDFYRKIGFETDEVFNLPNGAVITLMKCDGETEIELIQDNKNKPGLYSTGILVEDLEKEVENLKNRGIQFKMEPTRISVGYMAMFHDPDNINIVLIQHDN